MQVPAGTTVENDFYQIDFGNAYKSNLVSFDTPPAAPVGESGGPTSTPVTPVEEVPVQQQAIKVLIILVKNQLQLLLLQVQLF